MFKKFNALAKKLKGHKKPILIALLIVVLLAGGALALNAKHNADKRKEAKAHQKQGGKEVESIQKPSIYTFDSAAVSCKEVQLTPKGTDTTTVCSGTATLVDSKTNKKTTYKVSGETHLYKNQTEVSLDQFSAIPSGKALQLTNFTGKDKKTLLNVAYAE